MADKDATAAGSVALSLRIEGTADGHAIQGGLGTSPSCARTEGGFVTSFVALYESHADELWAGFDGHVNFERFRAAAAATVAADGN